MQTILIVDDNISMTRPLQAYLEKQGYKTVVADNGQNALYTARHAKPDLILLDVMMPILDGFGFIEAFRKEDDAPIILVSAKLEEADKVKGLRLGADDYVTKPVGLAELLARIEAVLRRYGSTREIPVLRVRELELDKTAQTCSFKGELLDLTPSEFSFLEIFLENPMRTFSRTDLIENLEEASLDASDRTVDYHIFNLRKKLGDNPKKPDYIETVFGKGYRFKVTN